MHFHRTEQFIPILRHFFERRTDSFGRFPLTDQRPCMGIIRALPQQKAYFRSSTGFQIEMHLIGSAWISARLCQSLQSPPAEACRTFQISLAAQKFLTTGGKPVQRLISGQECRALGKIRIPSIVRDNRFTFRLIRTVHSRPRNAAQRSEQPVDVVSGGDPAMPLGVVGQAHPENLDRIVDRHKDTKVLFDPVRDFSPVSITGTMSDLAIGLTSSRPRRRGPYLGCLFVAQIENL